MLVWQWQAVTVSHKQVTVSQPATVTCLCYSDRLWQCQTSDSVTICHCHMLVLQWQAVTVSHKRQCHNLPLSHACVTVTGCDSVTQATVSQPATVTCLCDSDRLWQCHTSDSVTTYHRHTIKLATGGSTADMLAHHCQTSSTKVPAACTLFIMPS